jgi:protein TonB
MYEERPQITPSLLASILLHLCAGLALLIFWPKAPPPPPLTMGSTVPVTIVTDGPPKIAEAEKAPEVVAAATEQPAPQAPVVLPAPVPTPIPAPKPAPAVPAPAPKPRPVPAVPTPAPAAKPKPVPAAATPAPAAKPRPVPAKPGAGAPAQAQPDFFASTSKLFSPPTKGGGQKSSAQQGPTHKATAPTPTHGDAKATTGPPFADLAAPLMRLWNPNCQVEGGGGVKFTMTVRLSTDGHFLDEPKATRGMSDEPIVQAAILRAKSAMRQVEPFPVPPGFAGGVTNFNFDAPAVCRSRQ